MERLNWKTFSSHKKEFFGRMLIAAVLAFSFVACSDDGGGGGVIIPIGGVGACNGCEEVNQSPMVLTSFSAANVQQAVVLQNVQLYGSQMRLMSQSTPMNTPYASYYGPVAATGQFVATQFLRDNMGRCQIPPGTYQITTGTAGRLGSPVGGNLELPDLVLTPGYIRIQITQGIMYSGGSKLMGIIRIISANGVQCAPDFVDNLY